MTLNNFISNDAVDVWEVDYYDHTHNGYKLAEPLLGVRVNGGTWLEVSSLISYIEDKKVKDDRDNNR